MGRLNNIAECKSFMTENGNRAVHRSTTLRPDCTSRSPAQKNVWRCVVSRPVVPAITPKQQKTLLRWDGFSLFDIFLVLTNFAAFCL